MSSRPEDEARASRAEARRARMVIQRSRLGDAVDVCPVSGEQAFLLVAELSAAAWTLAGHTLPEPGQRPMPIRFERRKP